MIQTRQNPEPEPSSAETPAVDDWFESKGEIRKRTGTLFSPLTLNYMIKHFPITFHLRIVRGGAKQRSESDTKPARDNNRSGARYRLDCCLAAKSKDLDICIYVLRRKS